MKIKDLFILGIKSLKHLSLKKKIFLVIQIFIMLLILIPFSFYSVFSNASNTIVDNQFEFREISLYGTSKDYEKYQDVLDDYENEHIIYIDELAVPSINGYTNKDSENNFTLKRALDNFTPITTNGNDLKDEFDIICPEMASDNYFENLNYDELINLDAKIGDIITLNFYNKDEYIFSQDFKLVGTYNADFYYSYDTCYILNTTYENILSKINTTNYENDENSVKALFTLYIDSEKNVADIINYLENEDIIVSVPELEDSFVHYILLLSLVIMIILTIISIILLINYFKNYYYEEYYNISLYKALGFKDRDIINIIFIENILLILISLIISIILFIILKYIVTIYLHQFVAFRIVEINLSIIPLVIYYLIVAILNYVFLKIDINEISKLSIKGIGEL